MNRPLSERQLEVLQWIADGCPRRAWPDHAYKTVAGALMNRRLAAVSKKGGIWRATITDAGQFYVDNGRYPDGHVKPKPVKEMVAEKPPQSATPSMATIEHVVAAEPPASTTDVTNSPRSVELVMEVRTPGGALHVGDEWIYRLRDYAPSERVRIVGLEKRKTAFRADVEFLDAAPRTENVPGARLRGPWSDVAQYDETMAGWRSIDAGDLTDAEEASIDVVFKVIVPMDVAEWKWNPVRYTVAIYDRPSLASIVGQQFDEWLSRNAHFDLDAVTMVSREGAIELVELVCRQNPMPMLEWVIGEEARIQLECEHGDDADYQWYLEYDRPLHELIRQWCGHRAINVQERLAAAEQEVRRLNGLLTRTVERLHKLGDGSHADQFERDRREGRITPHSIRPVVDRPLSPSEIPVVYVDRPRRGRRW